MFSVPQHRLFFLTPPPGRFTSWCCAAWCSSWSLPWPGGIRPSSSSTQEPGPQGNSSWSLGKFLTNPFHWIHPSSSSTPEPGPPGDRSSSLGKFLTNPFHWINPSSSSTLEPGHKGTAPHLQVGFWPTSFLGSAPVPALLQLLIFR
jgi:hypothetical protein